MAGVILASVFLSLFGGFLLIYKRQSAELEFVREAEELAGVLNSLARQDPGAQVMFELEVPEGCELRFENLRLTALVDGENLTFELSAPVAGPLLKGGRAKLILRRVEGGVEVEEL